MHADWPSCSTTRVLRSPSSSFSIQSDFLHPLAVGLELPEVGAELLDVRRHPLLVGLVGEVGAQRAAAGVGCVGVDALAALAEDAVVARGQPGQVAAEHLVGVAGVGELDEGTGEDQIDLGHRDQPTAGVARG